MRIVTNENEDPNGFSSTAEEFMRHIQPYCYQLTSDIAVLAKQVSKKIPFLVLIHMAVVQGYLNGCLDTINSEDKECTDEYTIKLRSLLLPVRIELEAMLRNQQRKDGKDRGSSGRH